MFSQQAQSTPWAQKTSSAAFTLGTPGNVPSTPAFGSQPVLGVPGAAPASGTTIQQQSAWGSQSIFGTPQSSHGSTTAIAPHASPANPGYAPQPSPASQAPVNYLPGYLSRMRSERPSAAPHRVGAESNSPVAARDADVSLLATSERPSHSHPSPSPTHGFQSSFFRSSMDESHSAAPASMRESSIFGSGGLRGRSVKPDDSDRSLSRAPLSPPTHSPAMLPADVMGMDDDDAPPADTLSDVAQQPRSFDAAPTALGTGPSPVASRAPPASSAGVPMAQRTVLVYGFPAYLRQVVVEQFGAMGPIERIEDVNMSHGTVSTVPRPVRITYAKPFQALHAVRRSGELVAGACFVGVRWEDEAMHQASLLGGVDAPLLGATPKQAPTTPAPARAGTGRTTGTPLVGRPIHMVDTPVSALAPQTGKSATDSPLHAVVRAGESLWRSSMGASAPPSTAAQSASAQAPSQGVLGRLADGLFGW